MKLMRKYCQNIFLKGIEYEGIPVTHGIAERERTVITVLNIMKGKCLCGRLDATPIQRSRLKVHNWYMHTLTPAQIH